MPKKLTITLDEQVYNGLLAVIGPRNISQFIERLVRPYVIRQDLESAYREMALDEARETATLDWAEHLTGDSNDENLRWNTL